MEGKGRVYNTKKTGRKHKAIQIHDPKFEWHDMIVKVLEKNENVLYPDERTITSFLKLCIKYGDVCIDAINRQRFAVTQRKLTIAQKKAQALKDAGLDGINQ